MNIKHFLCFAGAMFLLSGCRPSDSSKEENKQEGSQQQETGDNNQTQGNNNNENQEYELTSQQRSNLISSLEQMTNYSLGLEVLIDYGTVDTSSYNYRSFEEHNALLKVDSSRFTIDTENVRKEYYNLKEFLKINTYYTLEDLKGLTDGSVVDEENNVFISYDEYHDSHLYGYDDTVSQFFRYDSPDECSYCFDNVYDLSPTLFNGLKSLLADSITNGTFDKTKNTLRKDNINSLELSVFIYMLSEINIPISAIEFKLNNNQITSADLFFDFQNIAGNAIKMNELVISFTLKDIGTTNLGEQPSFDIRCPHDGGQGILEFDDGYRTYCSDCKKYLCNITPYNYDETTHICPVSGHIDGLSKEVYSDTILEKDENHERYLYGYQVGYDNKIYNIHFFPAQYFGDSAYQYHLDIVSSYGCGDYTCIVSEKFGYVILSKQINVIPVSDSPYALVETEYRIYTTDSIPSFSKFEWPLGVEDLNNLWAKESIETIHSYTSENRS